MPEILGPWDSLLKPVEPLAFLVLRAAVVYVFMVVLLRLAGKREIGQMTPFDLVLILLIANAVQNAMVGEDTSLTSGLISVLVLFGLNWLLGRVEATNPFFRRLAVGVPVVLVHDGRIVEDQLRRENLSRDDLLEQMREHGIARLGDVAEAILEPDGNFSFISMTAEGVHPRKKRAGQFGARPGGTDRCTK
jgi:uncharacterized membrane protein YcaP (DUF421 family)